MIDEERSGGKRRANGRGTTYRRRDGRWVASLRDPLTGKRRYAYAATRQQAQRKLTEMLANAQTQQVVLDAGATLSEYSEHWFAGDAKRRRASATYRIYQQRFRKHILPVLGRHRMNSIRIPDIEDLFDHMASVGYSKSTIQGVKNALSALFTDAVRRGHLGNNIVRLTQLPEGAEGRKTTFAPTKVQVAELLRNSWESGDLELHAIIALVAYTGARTGEALGAQWDDMDLVSGTWTVRRTLTLDESGRVVLGNSTKTKRERTLRLASELISILREHRSQILKLQVASPIWNDHDLVFPTSIGTTHDPSNVRQRLIAIRPDNFQGSFRSLRYFNASAVSKEIPLVILQKHMGHTDIRTTTNIYHHLYDEDEQIASASIAAAIASGQSQLSQ